MPPKSENAKKPESGKTISQNPPYWLVLADELENWILREFLQQNPSGELPSINSLAKTYEVAYVTMRKVIHHLGKKGLLQVSQGRRPQLAHRGYRKKIPPPSGITEKTTKSIIDNIRMGHFRPGKPLPKLDRLVQTLNCSRGTLLKALAEVENQGLLHRRSRKFCVGTDRGVYETPKKQKIIAVIFQMRNAWQKLNNSWTQSFGITFMQEAMASGITIIPIGAVTTSKIELPELKKKVLNRLYPFEDNWIGTLLVEEFEQTDEFRDLIRLLSTRNRRLIHFGRRALNISYKNLVTAKYDASSHSKEGLFHLIRNGHNSIGYQYDETQSWAVSRLDDLKKAVADLSPSSQVETFGSALTQIRKKLQSAPPNNLNSLNPKAVSGFSKLVHALQAQGKVQKQIVPLDLLHNLLIQLPRTSTGKQMRDWIRNKLPDLLGVKKAPIEITDVIQILPFICNSEITALILSRDRNLLRILQAFESLETKIPEDVSLVSYDNETAYRNLPVDSVDPGIGNLGYQAYHYLSQDIGIRVQQKQTIYGLPRVVVRGSCKPPE